MPSVCTVCVFIFLIASTGTTQIKLYVTIGGCGLMSGRRRRIEQIKKRFNLCGNRTIHLEFIQTENFTKKGVKLLYLLNSGGHAYSRV